jgi:cytochrome c oxidase cbb3-type subunit 4
MDDITILRVTTTVLSFLCFIGIMLWTLDRRKTRRFEEASLLPFLDE